MNSKLLSALALASVTLVSQQASASDGTITFNGEIVANTCVVTTGSGGSFTVTLPKVMASALASVGATAGRTPFQIALTGCNNAQNGMNVHTYFEPGSTVDSVTGKLKTTNATVQIGLVNGDGVPIKAGFADATQGSKLVVISGGGATLPYFAEYYANEVAVPGVANTTVVYTLVYN